MLQIRPWFPRDRFHSAASELLPRCRFDRMLQPERSPLEWEIEWPWIGNNVNKHGRIHTSTATLVADVWAGVEDPCIERLTDEEEQQVALSSASSTKNRTVNKTKSCFATVTRVFKAISSSDKDSQFQGSAGCRTTRVRRYETFGEAFPTTYPHSYQRGRRGKKHLVQFRDAKWRSRHCHCFSCNCRNM